MCLDTTDETKSRSNVLKVIAFGRTDMRKEIDGPATFIQDSFGLDPESDAIFYSQVHEMEINVYTNWVYMRCLDLGLHKGQIYNG